MKQRIAFITIAVNDIKKSLDFYRQGMGLTSQGVIGSEFNDEITGANGAVAFFELPGGLLLILYERTNLAKDASTTLDQVSSTELSIGIAAGSRQEVDALLKQAEAVGATLTKEPHDRPWGVYSGYCKDPDGHLWEVTYDPEASY